MGAMDHIQYLMDKADENLAAAKKILSDAYPDISASRAYYAMFYAAEAALLTKGLQFAKHSGVISNFNKEFIKTGILPETMSKQIQKGFRFRTQGDYGLVPVEPAQAESILESAAEFVRSVRDYLEKEGFLDR